MTAKPSVDQFVPPPAAVLRPDTIVELLNRSAAASPAGEALVVGDQRRSYRQLQDEATTLAAGLLDAGLQPGDRVCLFAPNIVESYIALFATAKAGAVFVPVNPRLTERELRVVLAKAQAKVLLFIPEFNGIDYIERLRGIYPELTGDKNPPSDPPACKLVTLRGSAPGAVSLDELMTEGRAPENAAPQLAAESAVTSASPALLQFTSGTTSTPKAALLAHGPVARMSFELGERFGLTPEDRYFGCPPICHLGGTAFSLLAVLSHGATFVTLPVFEAGLALATMAAEGCTVDHGIDSHLRLQMSHASFDPARLSLRLVSVSAVAQTVQDVARAFGGVTVISQYGSTETGGAPVCAAFDDPPGKRLGTVGRALPGVQLDVVDPASGKRLPADETGEIRLGGWSLMVGYLDQPEETSQLFDDDGRMKTGDLGFLDRDGYLHFTGRLKNMLRSGGENVSLEELEAVITDFPGIALAVVVGVPDERLGEVGYAFVVSAEPGRVSTAALRAHCLGQLAKFKVPKYFELYAPADLPMTGNGKIDRRKLQARALDQRRASGE